jgi:hypothetical protein
LVSIITWKLLLFSQLFTQKKIYESNSAFAKL